MGPFFQNKANVITAGLILVVLFGGGYFLFSSRQPVNTEESFVSPDTQSLPIGFGAMVASSNAGASTNLISVLSGLRSISLDPTIFQDPAFLSLQDFGIPLQEEQIGRYNPFLPIGIEGVGVVSSEINTVGSTTSPLNLSAPSR